MNRTKGQRDIIRKYRCLFYLKEEWKVSLTLKENNPVEEKEAITAKALLQE